MSEEDCEIKWHNKPSEYMLLTRTVHQAVILSVEHIGVQAVVSGVDPQEAAGTAAENADVKFSHSREYWLLGPYQRETGSV